jgi:hypothetical protein
MSSRKMASEHLADVVVDGRVRLAQTHDARLHEGVEEGAQDLLAVLLPLARGPVVGERRGAQAAGPDAADGLHHRRARAAGCDACHQVFPRDGVALLTDLRLEGAVEVLHGDLAPLETRPGARGAGLHHDPVDEALRQPPLALVGGDGVQRGVEDDPAQVEDHGAPGHGVRR